MARKGLTQVPEPHIVKRGYGPDGKLRWEIADNLVEHDPAKVQEHLDNIARIWARAEARKAMEEAEKKLGS